MSKYINDLKNKISKEILEDLYCNQFLSVKECALQLQVTYNAISNLIKEYNLSKDNHTSRSIKNKEVKNRQYNLVKDTVTYDALKQYYIDEDNSYSQTLNYFNITQWTLDRLLKEYNLKKDRKISSKRSVTTRYEQAGGKDNYLRKVNDKIEKTRIEKYGSIENYREYISSQNKIAWSNCSEEEKKDRSTRTIEHGGGWNKDTAKATLISKYGVDNAYKLAKQYQTNSKVNNEFAKELDALGLDYVREVLIEDKRYDFKVKNTLVEIDPWPFHNVTWCPIEQANLISKNYHYEKSKIAWNNNLRCIHVWDWDDKTKILSLLFSEKDNIPARKCEIKELDRETAKKFINEYHLQGYAKDTIRIGLYYNDKLISLMTFGKPRYNKNYEWELIRYCSSKNITGGAEKIFNYFIKTYSPNSVISYCDLSKFSGDIYYKLGFTLLKKSNPSKHWYNIKTQQHITDNLLRQRGFDQLLGKQYGYYGKGTSNESLMISHGFVEIYDVGQSTFIWNNN